MAYVYVADRERALGFYRDVLGLEVTDSDAYGDFLGLAGGARLRITVIPEQAGGPHPVAGWAVADIAAAVRALKGRGVAFQVYEGLGQDADGVWTSADGGKLAFFTDPDGNVLTLSQD